MYVRMAIRQTMKDICNRTIAAIELDIMALEADLNRTPAYQTNKRSSIRQSIKYAREIINDLKERINS